MQKTDKLFIYTDGGARGNPGPAAIGVMICDEKGKILKKHSEFIGKTTNNCAEYNALIKALEFALSYSTSQISCFLDSQLVVRQLNKLYKVKSPSMRELLLKVRELENKLGKITYNYANRKHERIKLVDRLVNKMLNKI